MTASDRSASPRPLPKPGILDIAAYVGGKSKIEGIAHPVKLSSNENVLGCSQQAKASGYTTMLFDMRFPEVEG